MTDLALKLFGCELLEVPLTREDSEHTQRSIRDLYLIAPRLFGRCNGLDRHADGMNRGPRLPIASHTTAQCAWRASASGRRAVGYRSLPGDEVLSDSSHVVAANIPARVREGKAPPSAPKGSAVRSKQTIRVVTYAFGHVRRQRHPLMPLYPGYASRSGISIFSNREIASLSMSLCFFIRYSCSWSTYPLSTSSCMVSSRSRCSSRNSANRA